MNQLESASLTQCHVCSAELLPHPLYAKSGAKYCSKDGDFFIQVLHGKSTVVFRPLVIKKAKPREKKIKPPSRSPRKSVRCDQTGVIYETLKEVTDVLGVNKNSIYRHLQGKIRHVRGYTFTVIFPTEEAPPFVAKPRLRPGGGRPTVTVRCDQTGQVFSSRREAALTLQINVSDLSIHINNPQKKPAVKGYSFTVLGRGI